MRQTATWLGPPADPPAVVNEMEVVDAISDPEFDVIHAWRLRDRVIIRKDGRLPGEKKRGHLGESVRIGGILVMPK